MTKDEAEKSFWIAVVSAILFTIFGVYLLYKPNSTITMLSKGLSLVTLCIAIFGLFRYLTRKDKTKKIDLNIIYSVISIILTVVIYLHPFAISRIIPIALGSFMIINVILKLGYIKQIRKNEQKDFGTCIFTFIIMLILGIILIFNPLRIVLNTNQTIGIIIIFYSVLDIILCYLFKNNIS